MTYKQLGTLRQRAEYTHKFNRDAGRHGWLRLTPAYSKRIVEEILEGTNPPDSVLDPFCGTGTTALSAVNRGHPAVTVDINPFLVWFTRAKTARYSSDDLMQAKDVAERVLEHVTRRDLEPAPEPQIHRIERWWTEDARSFLRHLKAAIQSVAGDMEPVSNLLHVAFCRTLIQLSNAAFNHQSMSFKNNSQREFGHQMGFDFVFLNDLRFIIDGARENPIENPIVICGDARELSQYLDDCVDVVISSPPYANRVSYIRELRPYMFWLGYLNNGRDAGELDWRSIGGTWGIATSRLSGWSASDGWQPPARLSTVLDRIASEHHQSGELLANYVAKYCEDMANHFEELRKVLNPGARIHYIVGNSTFYGVVVPSEQVYASVLRECGFDHIEIRAIRKRNSKKELVEFEVSATWPGDV